MSQNFAQYDHPSQFEPLWPAERHLVRLQELASDLTRVAGRLQIGGGACAALRTLMRSMNSYYTNRIEGVHTLPSEIAKALRQEFAGDAAQARKQRLAIAHIDAEKACEALVDEKLAQQPAGRPDEVLRWLYSTEALCLIHHELFSRVEAADLQLADGSRLVPGEIRGREVAVGIHGPPLAATLPAFLARWTEVYGGAARGEASLVAMAAAHHRLAWIHPFMDGNGRVMRLHAHLVLHALGMLRGVWSPLRGFARREADYKRLLADADQPRRGDLDGRGNLTEAGLVTWVEYVLSTCIDQASFMEQLLDFAGIRDRIEAALQFEQHGLKSGVRVEALLPLHYLFTTGLELPRADFKAMSGLGDRLGTSLISNLLKREFLSTSSPYGPLRFAIPQHALRFYFPALWPEAEQDAMAG